MFAVIAGILGCAALFAVYGLLGMRANRLASSCGGCPLINRCSSKQRLSIHERPASGVTRPDPDRARPGCCG